MPDAFHVRHEEDDFEHWMRYGFVLEDEDTFRLEAQEFVDREVEKAPAPFWSRFPVLGGPTL